MKKPASEHDLILKHAVDGDPSAFMAFFREDAAELYSGMRNRGVPHRQTVTMLTSHIRRLYLSFIRSRPVRRPREWFMKKSSRILDVKGKHGETDEVFIGNIGDTGFGEFEAAVARLLQREYGFLRSDGRHAAARVRPFIPGLGRISLSAIIVFLAFAAFEAFLAYTGSSVDMTMTLPSYVVEFSLPMILKKEEAGNILKGEEPEPQEAPGLDISSEPEPATATPAKHKKQADVSVARQPEPSRVQPVPKTDTSPAVSPAASVPAAVPENKTGHAAPHEKSVIEQPVQRKTPESPAAVEKRMSADDRPKQVYTGDKRDPADSVSIWEKPDADKRENPKKSPENSGLPLYGGEKETGPDAGASAE